MSAARALLAIVLLAGGMRSAAAALPRPEGFGSDTRAFEAWLAFQEDHPIRSRELAERLLTAEPESFAAHCLLAQVLRRAEGNPAQALRHAEQCRAGFEARHGADPDADAPWFWHRFALYELYAVSEDLEHHAQSLVYLDAFERYHPGLIDAFRGWPLLRLGRLDEGRAAAQRALARKANAVQVAKAWTVLCALEAQAGDARAAYAACQKALETGPNPDDRAVRLVNLAEAARALQRFDEVEMLLRDAARNFARGSLAAPWMELVELYVGQGRVPEAQGALREMYDWQRRQPPATRAHNGARHERAAALFMLAAGRPVEAARIAERALEKPDRAGDLSASRAQLESAAALLARACCSSAAEQRLEEASWSGPRARLGAWADFARLRWCAWRAERRAASLLAARHVLRGRVQPYAPGSIQIPEWLEPDVIEVAGPGVTQLLLERAQSQGRLDATSGYALAYAAEIASQRGAAGEALSRAVAALDALPAAETLLRARSAVLAGNAALTLGDPAGAAGHFALALQLDGGALRRAGSALPVSFEPDDGDVTQTAARVLLGSPRLRRERGGLRLVLREDSGRASACLVNAHTAQLLCAAVESPRGEAPLVVARRLAAAFHTRAFAPRIELSQPDLNSLGGATAARSH